MGLSYKAAHNFLREKLKLDHWDVEKLASESREKKLEFLKEFVLAHGRHIYYQNVTWSSIPHEKRIIPTVNEVINTGLLNSGGTCIHLNYFIKVILETLGFHVFIVSANSPSWRVPKSHLMTIVQLNNDDETSKELYLIDMGFGRPFLEPVPLHTLPFRRKAGGYIYEFRFNEGNQNFERIVYEGCPIHGKLKEEESGRRLDYDFKLNPLLFEDFDESMKPIFTDSLKSDFLNGIFLFNLIRADTPEDFEYVCIHGKTMVEASRDTFKETNFPSYDDDSMIPFIQKYFPNLNWDEVKVALENYANHDKKKNAI